MIFRILDQLDSNCLEFKRLVNLSGSASTFFFKKHLQKCEYMHISVQRRFFAVNSQEQFEG